jgi:hypothetical protein
MKFIVQIGDLSALLSEAQVDVLTAMLDGSEVITSKYLGAGLGSNGTSYLEIIEPVNVRKSLGVRVMTTQEYDGMKLITKLHLASLKKP